MYVDFCYSEHLNSTLQTFLLLPIFACFSAKCTTESASPQRKSSSDLNKQLQWMFIRARGIRLAAQCSIAGLVLCVAGWCILVQRYKIQLLAVKQGNRWPVIFPPRPNSLEPP